MTWLLLYFVLKGSDLTFSLPKHLYRWWKLLHWMVSWRRFAGQQCSFQNLCSIFWSAWQVGMEARGHTTSYRHAGTTLRRTSSDVVMAVNGLTPFCLALPQLCLPAGLRPPWGSCRKLTAWIQTDQKAITCLVLHRMFSKLGNKYKFGQWFQLCWFWVCWVDIFQLVTWSCLNTSSGAIWTWETACWPFSYLCLVHLLKNHG